MYNLQETTKNELTEFLKKIDSYLDKELILVAIGGTALTLLDLKLSTRDIDLIVPRKKDFKLLVELFRKLNFTEIKKERWITGEGSIIDLYVEDYICNVKLLEPSTEKSQLLQKFDHLILRVLNLYDVAITKIDRGDKRDFEDIQLIFKKASLDISFLLNRYMLTMDYSESENPKYKLLIFIQYFQDLGYIIDPKVLEKVKQWQRT